MQVNLNREIRGYCPDSGPVRRILRDRGAVFIALANLCPDTQPNWRRCNSLADAFLRQGQIRSHLT